jgi:DNA-binding XRE family transcriptional regulator
MSGRTKWSALRDPVMADPQRRARIVARERAMEAIIELAKVREQRGVSQAELARGLDVTQANISKIEHKALSGEDLYLSTINNYITAMGGQLQLIAKFPDQEIPIPILMPSLDEAEASPSPVTPAQGQG